MLTTIENRFGVTVRQTLQSAGEAAITDPALGLVRDHPSLWPYFLYPPQGQLFVPPRGWADKPKVPVRVNHGSWQTVCPFCPSAQHAARTDPWFFCADCLNTAIGNLALPVMWPRNAARIEALLLERPFVTTRNWEPGETLKQLAAENAAHGVRDG